MRIISKKLHIWDSSIPEMRVEIVMNLKVAHWSLDGVILCLCCSLKNDFLLYFFDLQQFDDYLMNEIATEIILMTMFQVGYRVLGVQPNSPAAVGGLVSFFDFIVAANGIPLGTLDSTFVDLIKVTHPLYSIYSHSSFHSLCFLFLHYLSTIISYFNKNCSMDY